MATRQAVAAFMRLQFLLSAEDCEANLIADAGVARNRVYAGGHLPTANQREIAKQISSLYENASARAHFITYYEIIKKEG